MRQLCALLFVVAVSSGANAKDFPTVRELEGGLGYTPGMQLPKVIPARGKGYLVYYLHSRAVGNGEYEVRIRLR